MTLEQYSEILSVGTFLLGGASFLALIIYALSAKARQFFNSLGRPFFLNLMGIVVFFSIVGAFIYQLVYLTPVCELCWWQRIFMFPIAIVIPVGLYFRDRGTAIITGILAAFGMFFSAYHYYYHFQILVLGNALSIPCTTGLLPACTESPILIWGFVTIPLMALLGFFSIFILSFFAFFARHATSSSIAR